MSKPKTPSFRKLEGEVLEIIAEAKKRRHFFHRLLTNAVRFDILKKFKRNKTKKEPTKMEKSKTNKSKKPLTIEVRMLVPYAIITAIVIAAIGIWAGISYENNRVAEINSAVEKSVSKTSQQ